MKRGFTSKKQRKQAEDAIIRDMRVISDRLREHKKQSEEKVDKAQVMSILTRFIELKKITKSMH